LVVPPPVCEIGLVAFALFVAVCSVGAAGVPAPVLMPLGLVLFAVTLAQELSYCDGAPALLYAVPPLPPLGLFMPGSLCVEPGDVAELPGVSWAAFALGGLPNPHMLLGPPLLAYAGAAPMTAMATMQLAESSLCLTFALRFLGARRTAHPRGHDVDGHLVQMTFATFSIRTSMRVRRLYCFQVDQGHRSVNRTGWDAWHNWHNRR
jgi:hypothetical protein